MTRQRSSKPFYVEVKIPVVFKTPYHIGSGNDSALITDAPVLRLPDGRVFIPGSSIRGMLRAHAERESTLLGCSRKGVEGLFGPERTNRKDHYRGRLRVCDIYPEQQSKDEIRDHVAINRQWGAAETGAKYDMEAVLPSAQSSDNLRLIYEGDSINDEEYRLFQDAVDFIKRGRARIGAKSGWGFGRLTCKENEQVSVRKFDRYDSDELAAFLNMRLNEDEKYDENLPEATSQSKKEANQSLKPWAYLDMSLILRCEGPIIVKASIPPEPVAQGRPVNVARERTKYGEAGEKVADMIFITRASDGAKYFPGSSLRGVLRAQSHRICKVSPLLKMTKSPENRLFGIKKEGTGGSRTLLEVEDGELISENTPSYFDHVAIDRITNAAEDAAKFSTSPLISPQFRIRLTMRFTQDDLAALELLGFVLRDLIEGELWAGAGTGRGYGYIKKADIEKCDLELPESMPVFSTSHEGWQQVEIHRGRQKFSKDKIKEISDLMPLWTFCEDQLKPKLQSKGDAK